MAKTPNTIFAGTTGPSGDRPGFDSIASRALMYVVSTIVMPVASAIYGGWMALFTYARLPWWGPAPAAAFITLLAAITGDLPPGGVVHTLHGWKDAVENVQAGENLLLVFLKLLFSQAIFGAWIATCWASVVTAWKWVRRPEWQQRELRPGPVLKKRAADTASNIAAGTGSPASGITLGIARDLRDPRFAGGKPGEKFGNRVVISDEEAAGHMLVAGGSGSGKTTSMLIGMRDVIRLGRGLIVVDCKGGPDVPQQVADWCHRYGREFLHWSIHDPRNPYDGPADAPAFYDPLSRGDASRRKDLLIGSQRWDVEYYKTVIGNYLQTLFHVVDLVPPLEGVDTFTDVADLLSPTQLLYRAQYIPATDYPELASALTRLGEMEEAERSGIRNMYARLHTLTQSSAGAWLRLDPEGKRDIDLKRVAHEGQVVVFSLDTSNYEETATLIAGLIIQDLKTLSSELRHDPAPTPLHVYVDEFSAVDATNLLGLLAKARDAKMPVTLATQALADLQRREPTFVDQVLAIVSAFIIHRANTEADARIFAGLSGVVRKMQERMSLEQSTGAMGTFGAASATGFGYLEEREDYAISVGTFQELKRGIAVFIAKSPVARFVNPVEIVMENEAVAELKADQAVEVTHHTRVRPAPAARATFPHPASVALGKTVLPAEITPANPEVPALPGMPNRPGPKRPAAPASPGVGKAAGSPLPQHGAGSASRSAAAPMTRPQPGRGPGGPGRGSTAQDEWMTP